MGLDFSHIITQIVAFLAMLWILKRYSWQPLLKVLDERREKIKSEFDSIEKQKKDVAKLIDEYNQKLKEIESESRHKIQEAVAHGQKIAMEIQKETQVNAKEILAKARTQVGEIVANAKNQLKTDMVGIAVEIAEKILQENLDEQKHKKMIADFVENAELK